MHHKIRTLIHCSSEESCCAALMRGDSKERSLRSSLSPWDATCSSSPMKALTTMQSSSELPLSWQLLHLCFTLFSYPQALTSGWRVCSARISLPSTLLIALGALPRRKSTAESTAPPPRQGHLFVKAVCAVDSPGRVLFTRD